MKARKLKVCKSMDNDWLYSVYWNRGQGSITLGVMSLGRFSKKSKCIWLNNFYVCSPTLMKLIPYLASKLDVEAEWWPRAHNSWSYVPSIGFQILPFLKIFLTDSQEL